MQNKSIPSSTGGTIVEYFNEDGVRVKVIHSAGKAYSGKIAAQNPNQIKENKMNKYEKQAIFDMVKVSTIVLGAIAVVGVIIKMGVEANDLVGAMGFVAMGYCVYQLYRVRVGQLESEDKYKEIQSRYK